MSNLTSLSHELKSLHSPFGFEQQTFLGASITNFTMNCGMGESTSTLNVELVIDEFNSGDGTPAGFGQDIYHSGSFFPSGDRFAPPPIGSPVFFSFGHKRASIKDAYLKSFDDYYGFSNSNPSMNGYWHLTFGGILQSYNRNNSATNGERYSVGVTDPREVLANCQFILNNYASSTLNTNNLINIYGFLEHNLVDENQAFPNMSQDNNKLPVKKILKTDGTFMYHGSDMRYLNVPSSGNAINYVHSKLNMYGQMAYPINFYESIYDPRIFQSSIDIGFTRNSLTQFPLTGTGFSRIHNGGIPIYRVIQGLNALSGFNGPLPQEYKEAGYSGYIYFRGCKYVVDLTSLPIVDPMQRLDFDQMSILDFCLEMCEIANHDLVVVLLPIIDICGYYWNFNLNQASVSNPPFGGIIKVLSIDRSQPPSFGILEKFINSRKHPESTDVGFELANITSDKFIVGAQTVDHYFFTSANDKFLPSGSHYKLQDQFNLQILPYYGLINNKAVTIPKGHGPYKQILLDSSALNANGVGDFYVATEMELRCAAVSYEQWSNFLLSYDSKYMESVEADDIRDSITIQQSEQVGGGYWVAKEDNHAVTVPRCVWGPPEDEVKFSGELPIVTNFCNPPYGYPLYYKRATQIGIPEAGLAKTIDIGTRIITNLDTILNTDPNELGVVINNIYSELLENSKYSPELSQVELELNQLLKQWKQALQDGKPAPNIILNLQNLNKNAIAIVSKAKKQAKKSLRNAKRVYDFLKNIADECLGKKFLVKIPQRVNESFSHFINGIPNGGVFGTNLGNLVTTSGVDFNTGFSFSTNTSLHNNTNVASGPFGFMPISISSGYLNYTQSDSNFIPKMLGSGNLPQPPKKWKGALKLNKNPFNDDFEFNYVPEPNGGYYDFNMEKQLSGNNGPIGIRQGLVPIDTSLFIEDNGRLSAYVRFDNSHFLSFDKLSPDSFSQQKKEYNFFSPDVSYNLPNTFGMEEIPSEEDIDKNNENPSIAFVKCSLDSKFYMPPSGEFVDKKVYGSYVSKKIVKSKPKKVMDPKTCEIVDSITPYSIHFAATKKPSSSSYNLYDFKFNKKRSITNNLINSNSMNVYKPYLELDTRHVYALITLPEKISSTVTTLMSQKSEANIITYMHLIFADTMKSSQNPGGFDIMEGGGRAFPPNFNFKAYRDEFSLDELERTASEAENKAISGLTLASQKIEFASPSPVIPDMVSLPLMSKERCYGPWRSMMFHDLSRYKNINSGILDNEDLLLGGKIEFIKDENLAPWNFNGNFLMNEHGKSLAKFLSTPLICSERGGFTLVDAPSGISIGALLKYNEPDPNNPTIINTFYGPLITNISTVVSSDNIKTTYQCSSYTPSFGRLEKKRQELISKISRNQQKLKDEKNALIRKNIGKNQNNINYNKLYKDMLNIKSSNSEYSYAETGQGNNTGFWVYATKPKTQDYTLVKRSGVFEDKTEEIVNSFSEVSFTSTQNYAEMHSVLAQNPRGLLASEYFSAIQDPSESMIAASMDTFHPSMPTSSNEAMDNMEYGDSIEGITYWS